MHRGNFHLTVYAGSRSVGFRITQRYARHAESVLGVCRDLCYAGHNHVVLNGCPGVQNLDNTLSRVSILSIAKTIHELGYRFTQRRHRVISVLHHRLVFIMPCYGRFQGVCRGLCATAVSRCKQTFNHSPCQSVVPEPPPLYLRVCFERIPSVQNLAFSQAYRFFPLRKPMYS